MLFISLIDFHSSSAIYTCTAVSGSFSMQILGGNEIVVSGPVRDELRAKNRVPGGPLPRLHIEYSRHKRIRAIGGFI